MKRGGDIWRSERERALLLLSIGLGEVFFHFIIPLSPPSLISVSSRRRTARNYHSIRPSRGFINPRPYFCGCGLKFADFLFKKPRERNMIFVVFIGSGMR